MRRLTVAVCLGMFAVAAAAADEATATKEKPTLVESKLGNTKNVHLFGATMLCGQPTAEEFAEAKERGIKRVISLRQEGEIDWDQPAVLKQLGLEFHRLGFRSPESLTDELLDTARKMLVEKDTKPVMLQCGSANRVGAVWAAHRVLDEGVSVEDAIKEAKEVGLRNAEYEKKVRDYIARNQK